MFLRHDFILMSPTNWNMGMILISVSAITAFLGSGYDFSKPSFESSGVCTAGQSLSYYYLPHFLTWQGKTLGCLRLRRKKLMHLSRQGTGQTAKCGRYRKQSCVQRLKA